MTTSQFALTINGHRYGYRELVALCNATIAMEGISLWERDFYLFILEWLSDNDYVMVNTSGSTGTPKSYQQPKESMKNSALMTQRYFGLGTNTNGLLCLPVSYIAGKMMVVRAFVSGMNLVVVEPSSNPFVKVAEKIHFAAITPFQLALSLDAFKAKRIDAIIVGGGEIPTDLELKCQELPSDIYATYGMTETSSHVALRAVNGPSKSASYEVLSGVAIDVDDRQCLMIKAPHLTPYTLVTNDIVAIKDATHFEWLGRFDSVINSGGVKIFPEQVEKKLFTVIDRRYFVAALPDSVLGEQVTLFVEGDPLTAAELETLHENMAALLTKFETPKEIVFIKTFTLSDAGKILKKNIVASYRL